MEKDKAMLEHIKICIDKFNTREEAGAALGCDTSTVTKIYNGSRTPSRELIVKMCEVFNVSADYLLGLSDVMTNNKDIEFICEYTGLTECAILRLNRIKQYIDFSNSDIMGGVKEKKEYLGFINDFINFSEYDNCFCDNCFDDSPILLGVNAYIVELENAAETAKRLDNFPPFCNDAMEVKIKAEQYLYAAKGALFEATELFKGLIVKFAEEPEKAYKSALNNYMLRQNVEEKKRLKKLLNKGDLSNGNNNEAE